MIGLLGATRRVGRMFVDDARMAGFVVAWLLCTGLLLPIMGVASQWAGIVLFAGVAAILLEASLRSARRR